MRSKRIVSTQNKLFYFILELIVLMFVFLNSCFGMYIICYRYNFISNKNRINIYKNIKLEKIDFVPF